jgi:hypothetical protein
MDEDQLEAIVTRLENKLRAGWRSAMRELKDETKLADIERSIMNRDYFELVEGIEDAIASFTTDLAAGYVYAGQKAARLVDDDIEGSFRFDLADEAAVTWMRDTADRIASGLIQEQQATARLVVERGITNGRTSRQIAQDVQASIGLSPYQVQMVETYRAVLERSDFARARAYELADGRYDAMLDRRIGTDAPLGEDKIDTMVDRYRENWVDARGDDIAMQEAQNASNAGIDEALDQAIEAEAIDDYEKEWVSRHDAKVRPSHRMLNGQVLPHDELFHGINGDLAYPGDEEAPFSETCGCRCMLRRRWGAAGTHITVRTGPA